MIARFVRSAASGRRRGEHRATTMLRGAIAAVLIYAYGHPGLEVARPAMLDAALHGFHRDINTIIADGYRVITRFDNDRAVTVVKDYVTHLEDQARGKD